VFKVSAIGLTGENTSGFVTLKSRGNRAINYLASGKPLNEQTFTVDIVESTATGTISLSVQDTGLVGTNQTLSFDPTTKQLVFDLQSMENNRTGTDYKKITFVSMSVNFTLTSDGEQSVTINPVTSPKGVETFDLPAP
jgi:hypothetical protein